MIFSVPCLLHTMHFSLIIEDATPCHFLEETPKRFMCFTPMHYDGSIDEPVCCLLFVTACCAHIENTFVMFTLHLLSCSKQIDITFNGQAMSVMRRVTNRRCGAFTREDCKR